MDGTFQVLLEIDAKRDGIYILEHILVPEFRHEAITDAFRNIGAVITAIGNKDFGHQQRS